MSFPKPFLRRTFLLCAALLLLRPPVGAAPYGAGADTDTYTYPQSTVVGYYAGWSSYQGYQASDIPAHQLTHINYAFAMIDRTPAHWPWTIPHRMRKTLPISGHFGRNIHI